MSPTYNSADFIKSIATNGCQIVENILSVKQVSQLKMAVQEAIEIEKEYHKDNRDDKDYGMVLLCSLYDDLFSDILDHTPLMQPFNDVLGEGCVIYAYTSSSMPPFKSNYSNRIHVDCPRVIPNYITNMGATILLDDFTDENGATWFMSGSHERMDVPEGEFYEKAERLVYKAGSVWYFNARTWHAGGNNTTNQWRHAMTINMGRSWMKQRLDIPRAMRDAGKDISRLAKRAKQKLGFNAEVPASYSEYYQPFEKRKFKQEAE